MVLNLRVCFSGCVFGWFCAAFCGILVLNAADEPRADTGLRIYMEVEIMPQTFDQFAEQYHDLFSEEAPQPWCGGRNSRLPR